MIARISYCLVFMLPSAALGNLGGAVVEGTDPAFGDGTLTIDTIHNLAFLDLTIAADKSFDDVNSLLSNDPNYTDYRYASVAEITRLKESAYDSLDGAGAINELPFVSDKAAAARALSLILGITSNVAGNFPATKGITSDADLIDDMGPPIVRFTPFIQVNLMNQRQRSFTAASLISQLTDDGIMLEDNAKSPNI